MSNFKIVTDSGCDFTDEMYRDYDVACAPLSVMYKGVLHGNLTTEAQLKDLYDGIRAGELPTTSAANPDDWANVMRPALEAGQDVLTICFSGSMSTTYQSAVIAAGDLMEEFPDRKVIVVDSLAAALGQGLLVCHACAHRDAGESLEEVAAWVEANKLHICHWVTVDDLFHLKRGGRVSASTALVGTMLNIKPIIVVDDNGKLQTVSKARGRKSAMDTLVKKAAEAKPDTVFIAHGDCLADAEALAAALRDKHGVENIHIGYIGSAIGAHTGPGVLAVFFLGEKR